MAKPLIRPLISTEHTPTLITPSILVQAKKRTYPAYKYTRTDTIWPGRHSLLEYEEALEISAQMEEYLSGNGNSARSRSRSVASKTPASVRWSMTTSPTKSLMRSAGMDEEDELLGEAVLDEKPRIVAAKAARELLEMVYPKWQDLLDIKAEEDRSTALERFDCGMYLTSYFGT